MGDLSSVRKPSCLKPPSKIARPTNILLERNIDLTSSFNDGTHSSVRQLTKDSCDDSLKNRDDNKNSQTHSRKESNVSSAFSEDTDNFIVGDRVWVGGTKPGRIAFIGETQFGPGDWAGVVLDEPIGKNDGAVAGIRYFQCAPNKGIFSRLSRLSRYPTIGEYDYPQTSLHPAHNSTPVTPDRKHTLSSSSFSSSIVSQRARTPQSEQHSQPNFGNQKDVKVGDRVIVQSSHGSKAGVLRYYGTTEFGSGIWCGVELDDPLGKNDGSVAGFKYFDCAPKFGLFVPAEKVSRSPVSKQKTSSCVVHPDGVTRQGTLESLRSTTSTVQTSATTDLKSRKSMPRTIVTSARSTVTPTPKSPLQEQLKEKEAYIKQLLKERELERAQIITAARQAEEAEMKLLALKSEYDQAFLEHEIKNTNLVQTVEKLEKEKSELLHQLEEEKKKIEDLQFNFEEESITKSEIQALNEEYVEKLKNFEKVVTSQHASLEYDGQSSGIFTAESISEKGSSPGGQQTEQTDSTDELVTLRKMVVVLTERNSELENECQQLRDNLEKMKLIDKSKEEMLNALRNEITAYQQLDIGNIDETTVETSLTQKEQLEARLDELAKENNSLKQSLSVTNIKLLDIENSLLKKDEEILRFNILLEEERREAKIQIKNIKINMQFELDEYKIKIEDMSSRIDQLVEQVSAKENEVVLLINCIDRLCGELSERNEVISKVLLDNEETTTNIAEALVAFTSLRHRESSVQPEIEHFSPSSKEKILLLLERIEQITDNNVLLLKKLETLTEVISRKDALIEEAIREKEILRNEFHESMCQKVEELSQLERKFLDVDKVKCDIERQLQLSEENGKKLELLFSGKDEELRKEVQTARQDVEAKRIEYEELQQQLIKLKGELSNKEDQYKNTRDNFEKERHELQTQIEQVNNLLAKAIEEKRILRNDYIELWRLNELAINMSCESSDRTVSGKFESLEPADPDPDDLVHREAVDKNMRVLQLEYDKLKKKVEALTTENGEKQIRLISLEEQCKKFDEQKEMLTSESARLQHELQQAVAALESQKDQFLSSRNECAILRQNQEATSIDVNTCLNELRNEYKCLEDSFKSLEDCKCKVEEELKKTSTENIRMKSLLEAAKEENVDLMKRAKEFASENETLNKQMLEQERELSEVYCDLRKLKDNSSNASQELNHMRTLHETLEHVNKKLMADLNKMKTRVEELEESIRAKEDELLQKTCEFDENMRRVTNANIEVRTKEEIFRETTKHQAIELQNKLVELQDELKLKEKAYRNELAELEKNAQFLSREKENVTAQLENAQNEILKLSYNDNGGHITSVKNLGTLTEKKIADTENIITDDTSALKDNLNNNNVQEKTDNSHGIYLQIAEDREAAENQVHFLNSVIVDMQRKNETLLERVQYLERVIPPDLLKPKKTITPRMFCDICDMFDLHETEDCPKQSNSSPPSMKRDNPKSKPPPRPYCETCEVFGHTKAECNDEENF